MCGGGACIIGICGGAIISGAWPGPGGGIIISAPGAAPKGAAAGGGGL
jgi:hypothetical protein